MPRLSWKLILGTEQVLVSFVVEIRRWDKETAEPRHTCEAMRQAHFVFFPFTAEYTYGVMSAKDSILNESISDNAHVELTVWVIRPLVTEALLRPCSCSR